MERVLTFRIDVKGTTEEEQALAKLDLQLKNLIAEKKELEKVSQREGILSKENAAKLAAYTKEIDRMTNEKRNLTKVVGTAVDSLERMRAKLIQMKQAANSGSAELREKMSPAINKLTDDIKKAEAAQGTHTRNVGNYEGAIKNVVKQIGAWVLATISIATVTKIFKGVVESTDATMDAWEQTVEGIKQGFAAIARMVATLDFKDFVKNVKAAIDEGRRYAEQLDDIDEKTRALRIQEADAQTEITQLMLVQRKATTSVKEATEAGEKILAKEKELAVIRTGIARQAYENEAQNIASFMKISQEEVLGYVKKDAAIMKLAEAGRQYNEQLKLQKEAAALVNNPQVTQQQVDNYNAISFSVDNVSEEIKKWGFAMDRVATDPKMGLFVQKYEEWQAAIRSADENTMRTQIKNASLIDKGDKAGVKSKADALKEQEKLYKDYYDWIFDNIKASGDASKKAEEDYTKFVHEQIIKRQKAKEDAGVTEIKRLAEEHEKKDAEEAGFEKQRAELIKEIRQGAVDLTMTLYDAQFNKLDKQYKADIIAAGDNAVQKEKIEAEYLKKKNALAKKAAIAEKAMALFSIAIDTAKGVTNAMSKIVTIPLVPWIIASGIIQALIVAARPVPQFATGGKIVGGLQLHKDTSKDNTLIYAKQGEVVLNQRQQMSLGGSRVFRKIGVPGFAEGGMIGNPIPTIGETMSNSEMARLIANSLREIRVVQYLSDLHGAENDLEVSQQRSSL